MSENMMNNSVSSAAYVIDPLHLPVNQRCDIHLPSISLSKNSDLLNFIANFNVEETAESYDDNMYPTLEEQADSEFNSNTNILDLTNLDNQQNVLVFSNCPIYNQKFHFDENSFIFSSLPATISKCFAEEENIEIQVDTNEVSFNKKENGKYTQHYSPLTPPMSPKMSAKEIVEKARHYVAKKKAREVKPLGRPAKEDNKDIDELIEVFKKCKDKKKARIAKNNKASRVYRRNLSKRRETIDNKLADELKKFENLTRHHQNLEAEINRLKNMLGKAAV